jgi:hypothetical protein
MGYKYKAGDPAEGTWIPKDQLIEGNWYRGKCRNADKAKWEKGKFHYLRFKFGETFWEEIEHPEDDRGYDCFFPFEKIKIWI